jgi:conjugative transposon protein TcpC
MKPSVTFSTPKGGPPRSADRWFRAAGRLVLWALIVVVLVRGVSAIFAVERGPGDGRSPAFAAPVPDGEGRAFAVQFATAYLDASHHDTAVEGFLADGLSDRADMIVPRRGPGARVASAMVAREISLGESRALLTVAVSFDDGRTRYLSVPVARDSDGGLVVFEAPSFSPPPTRGTTSGTELSPLSDPGAEAIADLTGRFLRAYLAGAGRSALAYFLAPGVRLAPMGDGLEIVAVDGIDALDPPGSDGPRRMVLASVRVRDQATRVVYGLAYRVEVVRRGRWYVAAVAGAPAI